MHGLSDRKENKLDLRGGESSKTDGNKGDEEIVSALVILYDLEVVLDDSREAGTFEGSRTSGMLVVDMSCNTICSAYGSVSIRCDKKNDTR